MTESCRLPLSLSLCRSDGETAVEVTAVHQLTSLQLQHLQDTWFADVGRLIREIILDREFFLVKTRAGDRRLAATRRVFW